MNLDLEELAKRDARAVLTNSLKQNFVFPDTGHFAELPYSEQTTYSQLFDGHIVRATSVGLGMSDVFGKQVSETERAKEWDSVLKTLPQRIKDKGSLSSVLREAGEKGGMMIL